MLTPVQCLSEIDTSIPNATRRFHVNDELLGIDIGQVAMAKTFTGNIVSSNGDEEEHRLVELFVGGGFYAVTLLTNELESQLFNWTTAYGRKGD